MSPSGNTRPRQFGPVMSPSGNTRPRDHDASPDPRFLAPCPRRSLGEKPPDPALTAPEGAGDSKLLLLDERCDSSVDLREERPADQAGGHGVTTGPSRSVGSSTCATGSDAAWCTWISVREDGTGPGVFINGYRVGGSISPNREGSLLLALIEKGHEVATLCDSSLTGKMIERPLLSRGNTGSSLAECLGV